MKKIIYTIAALAVLSFILIAAGTQNETPKALTIGDKAPAFTAKSTKGDIKFPDDFYGKWKILFSHPGDFTPVCTSEMLELAKLKDEFADLNCALVGLSVDGIHSHYEWVRSMNNISINDETPVQVDFPIISDFDMKISKLYGMVHQNVNSTKPVRSVFIIDPDNKIRTIMFYPMETGRSTSELKRLLTALQTSDKYSIATPADWNPGDMVMIPTPVDPEGKHADKFYNKAGDEYICPTWYMCLKKLD